MVEEIKVFECVFSHPWTLRNSLIKIDSPVIVSYVIAHLPNCSKLTCPIWFGRDHVTFSLIFQMWLRQNTFGRCGSIIFYLEMSFTT